MHGVPHNVLKGCLWLQSEPQHGLWLPFLITHRAPQTPGFPICVAVYYSASFTPSNIFLFIPQTNIWSFLLSKFMNSTLKNIRHLICAGEASIIAKEIKYNTEVNDKEIWWWISDGKKISRMLPVVLGLSRESEERLLVVLTTPQRPLWETGIWRNSWMMWKTESCGSLTLQASRQKSS